MAQESNSRESIERVTTIARPTSIVPNLYPSIPNGTYYLALPTRHRDGSNPTSYDAPFKCYVVKIHKGQLSAARFGENGEPQHPTPYQWRRLASWASHGLFTSENPSSLVGLDALIVHLNHRTP